MTPPIPSFPSSLQVTIALLVCATLAGVLAWRRAGYRAVAVALGGMAAIDLVLLAIFDVSACPVGIRPALFMCWYGTEAIAASYVLGRDRSKLLLSIWTGFACLTALTWRLASPDMATIYGEALYTGGFAMSLVVQVGSLAIFVTRRPREVPTSAELAVVILVVSSVFDAVGPWIAGQPRRDWPYGAWISLMTWGMLAILEVLWISTRERSTPPSVS